MKKFIKENWFKIVTIIILMAITFFYILSNRYFFIHRAGQSGFINIIIRCDKLTGECQYIKVETAIKIKKTDPNIIN